MSQSFAPRFVPSDIISRWPCQALSLWKRSFHQQAFLLMSPALILQLVPAWSTLLSFVVAPALFVVAFVAAQVADEKKRFVWTDFASLALPGTLRVCALSLKFAAGFGVLAAVLSALASSLVHDDAVAAQQTAFAESLRSPPALPALPDSLPVEFLYFCATWAQGVMTMMVIGMFIVAIYHGVFGAILHAQAGMDTHASRRHGWQAWQVNTASIGQALREAPRSFWTAVAVAAISIMGAFQTVYLSPAGLLLATYVPCLTYVAYRSIFLGKHENVPASRQAAPERSNPLAPAAGRQARRVSCFVAKPK